MNDIKKDLTQVKFVELEGDRLVAVMKYFITEFSLEFLDKDEAIGSFIFVHGKYRFEFHANTQTYVLESRQFDQGKIQEDGESN